MKQHVWQAPAVKDPGDAESTNHTAPANFAYAGHTIAVPTTGNNAALIPATYN